MKTVQPKLLKKIDVMGTMVSFFSPPHGEPDFPWVDVNELVFALTKNTGAAKTMVENTHRFGEGEDRICETAMNGDNIATIIPHPMAQGLCASIDDIKGFKPEYEDENGPCCSSYCIAAGEVANIMIQGFDGLMRAYKNLGGPYLRNMK